MKKQTKDEASFDFGVYWIAMNDNPVEMDLESIAGYTTTLLLADLLDIEPKKVAKAILKLRKESQNEGTKT